MRVAAAVLTFRPVHNDRILLLVDAVASLGEADAVYVVDNSPDDESLETLRALFGNVTTNRGRLHTSGQGSNVCARTLELAEPFADVLVHSDDDMFWRPGWRDQLERWWAAASDDVALTGCHLEPQFFWNEIQAVVEFGGVRGLARHSTGAASWSYRPQHRDAIFPIPAQVQGVGDVPACQLLEAKGLGVCQIDLADHAETESTWGNVTLEKYGWDVTPVRKMLAMVPS